ncbi:MAG: hypothetical protein IT210_15755 [Armatimonadetes bacterium]|nr:hypothetical protein [Armatimonadota bacterium]
MIVSSAPGRAGIVGNPTDMYGGSVISCSTVKRAYTRIFPSDALTLEVGGQIQEICRESDLCMKGDYLDVARAILLALDELFSLDILESGQKFHLQAHTEIPMQAGLAGSTALVISLFGAVLAYLGFEMNPYEIAETAHHIEFEHMNVLCGFQDQHMATFGGLNFMEFREKERMIQDVDEPYAVIEPLAPYIGPLPFILAHTGISRNSGVVHRSIRDRWLDGEREVVGGYLRIAHLARLAKKAILAKNWEWLGDLMNENHAIQRKLGGSGPSNEELISTALENGALGAKLAGAGKGGTIIALTLDPQRTGQALRDAGAVLLEIASSPGLTVERKGNPLFRGVKAILPNGS